MIPGLMIFGDSSDVRVTGFAGAWTGAGGGVPVVAGYQDVLAGDVDWARLWSGPWLLRPESPGRSFAAARTILAAGADAAQEEGVPHLPQRAIASLLPDKGRIDFPRQWYLGFRRLLDAIVRAAADQPAAAFTSAPDEIAVMFDKPQCHARLRQAGIRVPASPGPVAGFDELRERMSALRMPRVFIKLNHGSSASGVVAYETGAGREQAWTTVELVQAAGGITLYNSRRLQRYTDPAAIRLLIDQLAKHGVHVERWLPKAAIDNRVCDLRLLVVRGEPAHAVVRLSQGPMTNLHLRNTRGDASLLRQRMGGAWDDLLETGRRVAACFPRCLHVGIDLAIEPGFRGHAVLEVNAFGDLLHEVRHEGLTPYELEARVLLEQRSPAMGAASC